MADHTTHRRRAARALARVAAIRQSHRYAETPSERRSLLLRARALVADVAAYQRTGQTASGLPL